MLVEVFSLQQTGQLSNMSQELVNPMTDKLYSVSDGEETSTFMFDDKLPSLPVPRLDNTVDKYLRSVRPFLDDEQMKHTEQVAEQFKNGIGRALQEKLEQKAAEERNWVRLISKGRVEFELFC